jgi:hypothetical protein
VAGCTGEGDLLLNAANETGNEGVQSGIQRAVGIAQTVIEVVTVAPRPPGVLPASNLRQHGGTGEALRVKIRQMSIIVIESRLIEGTYVRERTEVKQTGRQDTGAINHVGTQMTSNWHVKLAHAGRIHWSW